MSATSSPKSAHNKPSSDVENLFSAALRDVDPEINEAIKLELGRQRDEIELIASENIVSRAVLEAQGSVLTNKYAEGLPGKRYYGGCQFVDIAERLAIERVTRLFGCKFANVQPHSGASANAEVFFALMQPGDTFMGLNLAAGGHLTHGSPVNMSGKWFKPVPYGVRREDQRIDLVEVAKLAREHRPKLIIAGGSAYPRIIDFRAFREICDEVGALLMVDMAHFAGLVAGGVHPSPFPHAHVVTTTTHKTLRGPRGGVILSDNEEIAKKLNSAVFPGMQGGPLMHVIAAKAVAFGEALRPSFRTYARNVVIAGIGAEAWPQRLTERHRLGGDHMHQRAALHAGEHRRVEFLGDLFVVGQDHAAARPAQRLVRGSGHHMRMREWRGMHPARHQSGEVRHVHHQQRADLVADFAEGAEVDDARIGRTAGA